MLGLFLGMFSVILVALWISYESGFDSETGQVPHSQLAQAMQHFAFAATYFELYSEKAALLETTEKEFYHAVHQRHKITIPL